MRFTVKSLLATVVQVPESVEAHRRFVERVYVDNRQQIEDNIWPLASVAVGRKRSRTPSSDPADGSNESSPNKRAKSSNSSGSNNKAKKRKVKAAKKKKKRKFQTF